MSSVDYAKRLYALTEGCDEVVRDEVRQLQSWLSRVETPHYKAPEFLAYIYKNLFYELVRKHFTPEHPLFSKVNTLYEEVRSGVFKDLLFLGFPE